MPAFTVFAWDPGKADTNERTHGIDFGEASSAFLDRHALLMADPDAAECFVLLAMSLPIRNPVVCRCRMEEQHVVRIISARHATPGEIALYFRQASG